MMKSKDWYKSLTIWSGMFLILGAVLAYFGENTDLAWQLLGTGAGLIGVRRAID